MFIAIGWLLHTHNLPLEEWYFNDVNGTTVHTLDCPPAFALFEHALANNPLSQLVMPTNARCFQLLPDSDNLDTMGPSCFND
jgi:alpha-1,3-glucosyltransferase